MGRPPSNGAPTFRFNTAEVAEMEAILQAHNAAMPTREVLETLAQKFSTLPERSGKFVVQMKQVWNWFQNRRYAIRARTAKDPGKLNMTPLSRDDSAMAKNVSQAPQPQQPQRPQPQHPQPQRPQPQQAALVALRNVPQVPQHLPAPAGEAKFSHLQPSHGADRNVADSTPMEFEAKSARDGAWYDVANFLFHRNLETSDPEVLVRFAGFGAEEDEWVDIRRHVRQRSLPCESSECVAVLPGDLILCFQEGKEQALYFDAHVLDSQRRRHDIRGCRCRFLVRYDHDQSEEIVPLRKVCRRPETDYRLQLLHALDDSATAKQPKTGIEPPTASTLRVYPPPEATEKQLKKEEHADVIPVVPATSDSNLPADSDTKNQQPKVYEIVNAGTVENSSALPGTGVQLPDVPEVINAVIKRDPNATPGNDAVMNEDATKIQGDLNVTPENDDVLNEDAVNEAPTNIQGDPYATPENDDALNEDVVNEAATNIEGDTKGMSENDNVLNEDVVNEAPTNIQGDPYATPENEDVNEAATNIEGNTKGMSGNDDVLNKDDVNEAPTNIQGDLYATPEIDDVLNEDVVNEAATNIEGDTNGMSGNYGVLNEDAVNETVTSSTTVEQ